MGLLNDLPKPSVSKIGWPWTEETNTELYKKDIIYPKISIITPSYNQGEFIEETIRSVLLQNYPNLEFIIIDGGSTDNTLDILKKYDKWISYWVSEPDEGQSHALNKGLKRAQGDIIGWQNSDDIYYPNAFKHIWDLYSCSSKDVGIYTGNIYSIDKESNILRKSKYQRATFKKVLYDGFILSTQATFWQSDLMKYVDKIDESFNYGMDWDFFLRLLAKGKSSFTREYIGGFRVYEGTKTSEGGENHNDGDIIAKKWGVDRNSFDYKIKKKYYQFFRLIEHYLCTVLLRCR